MNCEPFDSTRRYDDRAEDTVRYNNKQTTMGKNCWLSFAGHLLSWQCIIAFEVSTVKNFRPVFPEDPNCRFFRSGALDKLSEADARSLLDALGSDVTVIDLRNHDEIKKETRSVGSSFFYENARYQYHIPILRDVHAFWDEAINRMDGPTKMIATLQTITQAGALDRAAARMLEDNGLSMLYTILLVTATKPLQQTLSVCAAAKGSVLFHCQKGKDRTGVVAMLLQSCRIEGSSDQVIIDQYAMSGDLLGESSDSAPSDQESSGNTGMVDWSRLRGSPPSAMEDTLSWIRHRYGSVQKYISNGLWMDSTMLEKLSK